MANGPTRPRPPLPKPLLTLGLLVLTLVVYFLLPVANDIGRAALALFVSLVLILLIGFLVPGVYGRVDRGSLLVHTSASFFFGLVSALFLALGNVFPWIFCWLVLCLFWTFLPNPSFHRSLEDNFGDPFS